MGGGQVALVVDVSKWHPIDLLVALVTIVVSIAFLLQVGDSLFTHQPIDPGVSIAFSGTLGLLVTHLTIRRGRR